MYIGFIDIGLYSSQTTRRVHLRCVDPKSMDEEQARGFAYQLKDVLQRCLAHVRVLDVKREGIDRERSTVQEAYDVSLWVGDLEERKKYREKKAAEPAAKTAAKAASSARGRGDSRRSWDDSWQGDSGSNANQRWQEGSWRSKRKWQD